MMNPNAKLLLTLLRKLTPTPAEVHVLLWTFFDSEDHLVCAERLMTREGLLPAQLEALPNSDRLSDRIADLGRIGMRSDSEAFCLFALRWLKGLDRLLHDIGSNLFDSKPYVGFKNRRYLLRPLTNPLADNRGRLSWSGTQGNQVAAYAWRLKPVPANRQGSYSLVCRNEKSWLPLYVRRRFSADRPGLRVMLWPLGSPVKHPEIEKLAERPGPRHFSLREISNESQVWDDIEKAVEAAEGHRVSLLILPELSLTVALETKLLRLLETKDQGSFPMLTLFGRCHRPSKDGLFANQAVLLGPRGEVLHVHQKLNPYHDQDLDWREQLDCGAEISILESWFGNIAPLICLDLFHNTVAAVLEQSHATVLCVPSLSFKTTAHDTAARRYMSSGLMSAFVSNRHPGFPERTAGKPSLENGASFYRIPSRTGFKLHAYHKTPFLLFDEESIKSQ